MQPTANYGLFSLAKELGKLVRELVSGQPGPLMRMEWYLWSRYSTAERRLAQQRKRK